MRRFKQLMSRYQRNRDLISVGAYVPGNDPELDLAIRLHPRMESFLQQDIHERADYEASIARLHDLFERTQHG
ncbi:Flagellum-specific ATP synthase [compost metagenome]